MFAQRDELWQQPCTAFNVQLTLPLKVREELVRVQEMLCRLVPLPLALIPASAMHVSVFALLPVRWQHDDKQTLWQTLSDEVHDVLTGYCLPAPRLLLNFVALQVTPGAILARALDDELVAAVRASLASLLSRRGLPVTRYDIVHATVARFRESGDLSSTVISDVESTALSLEGKIDRLCLVRERIYPSLVCDVLSEWSLR